MFSFWLGGLWNAFQYDLEELMFFGLLEDMKFI
jgi:hypothetical protein